MLSGTCDIKCGFQSAGEQTTQHLLFYFCSLYSLFLCLLFPQDFGSSVVLLSNALTNVQRHAYL